MSTVTGLWIVVGALFGVGQVITSEGTTTTVNGARKKDKDVDDNSRAAAKGVIHNYRLRSNELLSSLVLPVLSNLSKNMRTLLLLNIVITSTTAVYPMSGWVKYLPNGNCYLFVCDKVTFNEAKARCEKLGASLPTICDAGLNEFLAILIQGAMIDTWCSEHNVWFGLWREDESKLKMQWLSNSNCDYTHFESGEPNNYGDKEHCGHFWLSRGYNLWNDIECDKTQYFLCERNCNVPEITA
ncbi:hypothetical protein Q1695_008827 [Nippostrongylus brasiliensis]|nr:hypothetical protein Q1695_008827 [Nippostrongylus brasiliensis]